MPTEPTMNVVFGEKRSAKRPKNGSSTANGMAKAVWASQQPDGSIKYEAHQDPCLIYACDLEFIRDDRDEEHGA